MADQVIIERLEFHGHCGVTEEERHIPQPIAVDAELDYPPLALTHAAEADHIVRAIDYAQVAERIVHLGTAQAFSLLETLADRLGTMLLAEFPVTGFRLWVRKLAPPLKDVRGSVGVRLARTRASILPDPPPAPFLQEHITRLPKGKALDVAAGRGRNALYLAGLGWTVEAIDRDQDALAALEATAHRKNVPNLTVRTADLEADPNHPPDLGHNRFDVVLVFLYLHRPLFPALLRTLKPGGVLVYETFLIDNHLQRRHPRRTEFCLAHNELLRLAGSLRVLHYEEGDHGGPGNEPAFTARLIAQHEL